MRIHIHQKQLMSIGLIGALSLSICSCAQTETTTELVTEMTSTNIEETTTEATVSESTTEQTRNEGLVLHYHKDVKTGVKYVMGEK